MTTASDFLERARKLGREQTEAEEREAAAVAEREAQLLMHAARDLFGEHVGASVTNVNYDVSGEDRSGPGLRLGDLFLVESNGHHRIIGRCTDCKLFTVADAYLRGKDRTSESGAERIVRVRRNTATLGQMLERFVPRDLHECKGVPKRGTPAPRRKPVARRKSGPERVHDRKGKA